MAKRGRPKKIVEFDEVAEKKEEPRVRKRGDSVLCPKCDSDMFVSNSERYPGFCRVRHYKCASCGFIKKVS